MGDGVQTVGNRNATRSSAQNRGRNIKCKLGWNGFADVIVVTDVKSVTRPAYPAFVHLSLRVELRRVHCNSEYLSEDHPSSVI
jgi:hypothetical protein